MEARRPYTHDELQAMTARIERALEETQQQFSTARPLPPLTREECLDHLDGLLATAETRALTPDETFLCGQLHSQLVQAVRAEMLGKPAHERYHVIAESDLRRLADAGEGEG